MSLTERILRFLDRRAPAAPLAVTRAGLGLAGIAAAFESWRTLSRIAAPLVLPLPYVAGIPRLAPATIPMFALTWAAVAAAFAFGARTRLSGTLLMGLSGYALLVDQRMYSNHLYLFVLLVALVTIAGAPRRLPSAAGSNPKTVAAWPVFLLKVQVSLVYGFSALAKLTPDFLSGSVLADVMRSGVPRLPGAMAVLALITVVTELFVGAGLWNRRSRWLAVVAGLGLHVGMLLLLNTGRLSLAIFALELIATYPLFFSRDPRHPSAPVF